MHPSPSATMRNSVFGTPRGGAPNYLSRNKETPPQFGTPLNRRFVSEGDRRSDSPNQYMDVDSSRYSLERGKYSEESRVFAVSDTLSIRLASPLPVELHQEFSSSDPARDIFVGSVHVFPGPTTYGVVVTFKTCFVWRIDLQSSIHSPTCYMFPVPSSTSSSPYLTLPFAFLVHFGTSREPGLILVSSSGEVRFWDGIGIGLAGAERFSVTNMDLMENETIQGLEQIDHMVYVARTKSRLYRLTVAARPGTGKFVVIVAPFTDNSGRSTWLTSLRFFQRKNDPWESGDIVTVTTPADAFTARNSVLHRTEEKSIWVLTTQNLMQWNVGMSGGEQCVHNYDIRDIIKGAVSAGRQVDQAQLDLELLDVALDSVGDPVVLFSHLPLQDHDTSILEANTGPLRIYALIRFAVASHSDDLRVKTHVEILPYELPPDSRRALEPRFTILPNTTVAGLELTFSQFSDAFVFSAFEPPYQEQLHLKNPDDMILGFCVLDRSEGPELLLLTTGMVLMAQPNVENIRKIKDDISIGKANVLESTIRQAMKYGIKPENPLRFQLPSMADGDSLKTAAERMSHAFLTSDPDVVLPNLSLGSQLASREISLKALVTFIGESGTLTKLSVTMRENLLADAEKLAAARGVWLYHNEVAQKPTSLNLLLSAIEAYMRRINRPTDGDVLRTFFDAEIPNIQALVFEILTIVKSEMFSSDPAAQVDPHLLILAQGVGLVNALLSSAFNYRSQNRAKYQLTHPYVSPWTSEPRLLLNVRQLFEMIATAKAYDASSSDESEHTGHLLEQLASCLFKIYNDRLDCLNSRSEGGINERRRNKIEEEYQALRPIILDHLVRAGRIGYAFHLAETYKDFHALSDLSYHASAEKIMPASERIEIYINRFRSDFTTQLYQWYIEQGKLRLLFDGENKHAGYIDIFFSNNPNTRLSWIHDLAKRDYQESASALLKAAEEESNREAKHFMLSLGKLAAMAEGPAATPQDKVQAFDTSLDFMAIHDTLLEQFFEAGDAPAIYALESKVRAATLAKCTIPSDRQALQDVFKRILRKLLLGQTLSEEDAVDILSMKDNTETSSDFIDALNILIHSPYITDERKSLALRNVWRRIYLHDDWTVIREVANKTDYGLSNELRNTKLYQVLASPNLVRDTIILPSEATEVPAPGDIALRWTGMTPHQIQELAHDFETESKLLSSKGPTDAEFAHVRRQVESDLGVQL